MFKESAFAKKEQEELKEGVKKNEPLPDIEPTETIDRFKETIIGQEDAIASFAQLKEVLESEIRPERGPLHVEWLSGPSGVGKTEMVKKLIEMFIKDHANDFAGESGTDASASNKLVRIDGGSCQEPHSVAQVIGAYPGYVGYEAEPILGLENIVRHTIRYKDKAGNERKVCFVLIDEAEKANDALYRTLLPALDEGFLTVANGDKVDLRDCAFFFTSNLGHKEVKEAKEKGDPRSAAEIYREQFKEKFPPEFQGRIRSMTVFNELNKDEIAQIALLRVYDIEKMYKNSGINLTLELSDNAIRWIVENGYNQETGARSIQNLIRSNISDKLVSYNSKYDLRGVTLTMDVVEGENGKKELKFFPPEGGLKPRPEPKPEDVPPIVRPPRPGEKPEPEKPDAPTSEAVGFEITKDMLNEDVGRIVDEKNLKIISEKAEKLSGIFDEKTVIERLSDRENNYDSPPTRILSEEDLVRYLDQLIENNI